MNAGYFEQMLDRQQTKRARRDAAGPDRTKNHPRVERGVFLMRAKPLLLAGRVKRVSGTANRVTH